MNDDFIDFDYEEQIFYFFTNTVGLDEIVMEVTDRLHNTVFLYWTINVALNLPPVVNFGPYAHTVPSGMPFSFYHDATLFTDPDDVISAAYMTWDTGASLPDWISYFGTDYNYAGIAPEVMTATTYNFRIYAHDSRGAMSFTTVAITVTVNDPPVIDQDFD